MSQYFYKKFIFTNFVISAFPYIISKQSSFSLADIEIQVVCKLYCFAEGFTSDILSISLCFQESKQLSKGFKFCFQKY